jgi:hypothetical protein
MILLRNLIAAIRGLLERIRRKSRMGTRSIYEREPVNHY